MIHLGLMQFLQNCINEYLKQENIVESSKSTQKVIKTSEFALFLFNKEKENQAEIINNMNIKFADFEFQIASKIKKFGDCNHELEDSIIKKPTFLQTIFNKPLMQKYNEKIKEFILDRDHHSCRGVGWKRGGGFEHHS